MNIVCMKELRVRFLLLISVLLVSAGMWGADDGFTPTDGGLVVNLKRGQRILISTMVDHDKNPATPDREYFVENYTRYGGDDYFTYDNKYSEGHHLKLVMQEEGATEPARTSIWTVDTALTRVDVKNVVKGGANKDYALGGISYTIWNDNRTLSTTNSNNRWQFWGDLVEGTTSDKLCDVVFVVPTDYDHVTSFDPNRTITNSSDVRMRNKPVQDSKGRFNGRTGIGFMGMAYREVYWLEIPLFHTPVSYNNSALVVFNTTEADKTWGAGSIKPGCAGYAYNNKTHPKTPRTIFRLYILDEPFHSCPDTYSFAYDEQFTTKYRKSNTIGDSTGVKNVYTVDLSECMTHIPGTKYYQTDLMHVPEPDDSYYYVGWNDDYRNGYGGSPSERLGSSTAKSNFAPMSDLPLQYMPSTLKAPAGALGRMVVDTTSAADNLGVVFRPAGVFLKVDAGEGRYRNIEMHPEEGDTSWICNEMWTITDAYTDLTIKATLYTQPTFSDSDPGQDIEGWSEYIVGNTVPLAGGGGTVDGGMTGWARVYTNKSSKNGGLEFVQAEKDIYIRYNNNGHFGADIPETHAVAGEKSVVVQDHRLINGYNFRGWYTKADTTAGGGEWYQPGDEYTFTDSDGDGKDSLILYAQAKYEGGIDVAISFMKDGERYFMTHPGAQAPRFARARSFDDFTDTYQGMANADNIDPHYLSTYLLVGKNTICKECAPDEYVFDPKRELVKGGVDSLMFYENFAPDVEEYPGLYFTDPNVILANDTWAGLFKSSAGWPTPGDPCIESTKLSSTHYLSGFPDDIERVARGNNAKGSNIVYNAEYNQFDATLSAGTDFMISGVGVVDEHYVVLPDTLDDKAVWNDTIEFGLHSGASSNRQVWSKLIGKQLMLQMTMGDGKIVYFHPNDAKTVTTATDLRVTNAYGLTQTFEYIRDARVESLGTVDEEDKPEMSTPTDDFGRRITSGLSSPKDVEYESKYIDIIDTIRIALRPTPKSKIKAYYGRWKDGAAGLKKSATGTRYRDIIVRTKTYHYGDPRPVLELVPEHEVYSFNPLAGNERTVNFNLIRTTYRPLLDVNNKVVGEEAVSHDTINSSLKLAPVYCLFTSGGTYFEVPTAVSQTATVRAKTLNKSTDVKDTMIVSVDVTIGAVTYPVTARVPMTQLPLEGDELVWSVESGGNRYYIMAREDRLIFRQFQNKNGILYKNEDGKTALVKGSANASNSDTKYITPWYFSYNPEDPSFTQIALKTKYSVNRYFKIPADEVGSVATVHPTDSSYLIFHYENVYTNDNANEEEQVKLQYGANKWLQFTVTGGSGPQLKLVGSKEEASVFSWSYLLREHSLLNNGTYPSRDSVVFGYNTDMSVAIQTRYKAYKEYSMLVGNKVVYCCREDENDVRNLINDEQEWRTNFDIDYIPDARDFDGDEPVTSGLRHSLDTTTLTTTVSTSGATTSPMGITIGGKNVNIVDTLHVTLSLDKEAPAYRFKDKWSRFKSISDAELKIPLIRKVYHVEAFDSLKCFVENDEYNYVFPNSITGSVSHEFVLGTQRRTGRHVHDVNETSIAVIDVNVKDVTDSMKLNDIYKAQIRLIDETGKKPTWCNISAKSDHTITIECTESGIRTPRTAYVYVAYLIQFKGEAQPRFENFRFTVSQPSLYEYANNQVLVHNSGASGDPLDEKGRQQVHQNKRILYYYPEQDVELPIRDAHFFGWWRWFREGEGGIGDSDIPQEVWRKAPVNTGTWNIPFRIIGDSVPVDPENPAAGKKLVTMGRYTVFHYRSSQYSNVRLDPPCKTVSVAPPVTTYGEAIKPTVTYAVDLSNYYDKLPMSVSDKNQVDRARLDTMQRIPEPTLSLREVFELHPWTEMAARLEDYKSERTTNDEGEYELASERYMEDHMMMAPLGNQLLLKTEQRYNYTNLEKGKHSESLLGYYMRDDHWSDGEWDAARKDSMIWVAGWDADALWYTYNPKTKKYTPSDYKITESDDYLIVPKRNNIPSGQEFDTVYYCLRARSWSTTGDPALAPETPGAEETDSGAYMFNICRYMIIYHNPAQYGPLKETKQGGVDKAIITNDEIEQRYEVLERLDFDYNKPGSSYTVYPHPLPWADASYGYTYPETSTLPHNRLHTQSDLPNFGEYGLVNRVHYTDYWHDMQQHGGAENGYMIYCDGMASSGQVAALSLETHLCAGQKMFFSGYVGNPYKSTEAKYARPNFIITVQGSVNDTTWEDITSYTTGDLEPSKQWYQIFFPIIFNRDVDYKNFRVRIYNMASNWDGNDFVIDDMRIIATKPPLIAYHANTACKEKGDEDTPTHIILRVDYQGITGEGYNNVNVYYTVKEVDKDRKVSFVKMQDGYLAEEEHPKADDSKPDTICGKLFIPGKTYEPQHNDSIFVNMHELIDTFNVSNGKFKEGYIYEILEGVTRPVKYVVHSAYVNPVDTFTVHISAKYKDMLNSICGMTSYLEISNQMVLELNGAEQPELEILGLCANATYDIGLRVKGSLYLDNTAPIELNGTCQNDWLLYGDTTDAASLARYGYTYKNIVKVVKDILRCDPLGMTNANQFAQNLAEVSRNEMKRIMDNEGVRLDGTDAHPYDILAHLVNNGFLKLYQPRVTATVYTGDSVQYVIFPIKGTGTDSQHHRRVEVCDLPIFVKLKPSVDSEKVPLIVGGLHRAESELSQPVVVLENGAAANIGFKIRVDSIMNDVGIYSITLRSTDDPDFREGVHSLSLIPDQNYPKSPYYVKGDSILLRPAGSNNYQMREGYNYTYDIVMQSYGGSLTIDPDDPNSCRIGTVPFTLAVVPSYLRWSPQDENSTEWNNPANWLGIDSRDNIIHENARFAPLSTTSVLIPLMTDGMPYPELPSMPRPYEDSIQQAGFQYNTCEEIRFLPGAAMSQQQRMDYEEAIIDMPMPHNEWAFRAAPVQGMISGDIFMANADIANTTPLWEVGSFDAAGRTHKTGNASFWLSLYSSRVTHQNSEAVGDRTEVADAEWSKVTNGVTLSLPPAQGFAVYARTASLAPAVVRLPKNDDLYYYYNTDGDRIDELYEHELQDLRNTLSSNHAGELAFHPGKEATSQSYTITKQSESNTFVFGNPTMGYIDIWGFIHDNSLVEEIGYMASGNAYTTVTKATAEKTTDTISNPQRYLPPMHAMLVKVSEGTPTALYVTVNTNRVLTSPDKKVAIAAPIRMASRKYPKGIMTVTATNTVSPRCFSRLLLGQGYHDAMYEGEDALLTTLNIGHYTNNTTPATPFNLYAAEGEYGLCIDLRDSIENIPLSFFLSDLPFDPTTRLWFTGVNNISGSLVLYDALTDTERPIADGGFLDIVTPEQSHEIRYYIRRHGYNEQSATDTPVATGMLSGKEMDAAAVKFIKDGHVFILRDGHIYTMYGQKIR